MNKFNKIIVICPGNTVTGGPEAMHNLVHVLRKIGLNAQICYFPINQSFNTPAAYSEFNIKISNYEDAPGNLIIFPETFPMDALKVLHAQAAIWWLSVDHFTGNKNESIIRDKFNYLKLIANGLRPLRGTKSLENIIHFSQSYYSSIWLTSKGLNFQELYEPINQIYLENALKTSVENRKDQILYNPSKGKKIIEALKIKYPNFKFIALQKMNRNELIKLYCSSKVYIDFGHHPGRDRIPREAAVLGCCLITGRQGSAANQVDIPIDNNYKLDTTKQDFTKVFGILINSIFSQFNQHHLSQEPYRLRILEEPIYFEKNLKKIFFQH